MIHNIVNLNLLPSFTVDLLSKTVKEIANDLEKGLTFRVEQSCLKVFNESESPTPSPEVGKCLRKIIELAKEKGLSESLKVELAVINKFYGEEKPKDEYGRNPLHFAAAEGDLAGLTRLINEGADIEAKDANGHTALHWAASQGKLDCLNKLLENGAILEAKDNSGKTPLHFAVMHGKIDCLIRLIKGKADIEAKDAEGLTPLHYAALEGEVACLKKLLEEGADIEAKNKNSLTALHYAAAKGKLDCLIKLLEEEADINAKTNTHKSPLHFAAMWGHLNCVEKLLEKGVDIEAKDEGGITALHFAAKEGKLDCLIKLLDEGADIETKDKHQYTPLRVALIYQNFDCSIALIERGANVSAADHLGLPAFSALKERNQFFYKKIKEYFSLKKPELILHAKESFRQRAIGHSWRIKGTSAVFQRMPLEVSEPQSWNKKICQDLLEFQGKFKTKYPKLLTVDNVTLVKETLQNYADETDECILDKINQGKPVMIPIGHKGHGAVALIWGDHYIICNGANIVINFINSSIKLPNLDFYHCRSKFTLEIIKKMKQLKDGTSNEYVNYIQNNQSLIKNDLDKVLAHHLPKQGVDNCAWSSPNIAVRAMLMLVASYGVQDAKLANQTLNPGELENLIENAKNCDDERLAFHQIATLARGLKCIDKNRLDLLDRALIQTAMRKAYLLPLDETLSKQLEEITNKYMSVLEDDDLTDFVTSLQFWKAQKKGSFTDYGDPDLLKLNH